MFTPRNNDIEVYITNQADLVQLQIHGRGIDIPETDLSKVFNKFYWASEEEYADVEGTALELLDAKRIVEDHGGEIKVSSKDEQGIDLIITLPCFCEIIKA